MRTPPPRRGFVLLTVLWITVAVAALGVALTLAVRDAVSTSRNRVSLARATWGAEGCVAGVSSAADDALDTPGGDAAWATLDRILLDAPLLRDSNCRIEVRAAGAALNVNGADAEELTRLFAAAGLPSVYDDSLVDALLDWRDADAEPRPHGAERAWYADARRLPPRDGPFVDAREIALVRGMNLVPGVDSLLGVDAARIPLGRAPSAVLAALPGLDGEAVERIAELRAGGATSIDLSTLAGALSPAGRDTLNAHYAELARRVVGVPDAWVVTAHLSSGEPPVTATIEVRLVRAGSRVTIVRRRSWP